MPRTCVVLTVNCHIHICLLISRRKENPLAEEITTLAVPECINCGACCRLYTDIGVDDDEQGIPPELTETYPKPMYSERGIMRSRAMKIVTDADGKKRCIALDPTTNKCTIYANRPKVCSGFPRGSPGCHQSLWVVTYGQNRFASRFLEVRWTPNLKPPQHIYKFFSGGCSRWVERGSHSTPWICQYCHAKSQKLAAFRHTKTCIWHPDVIKKNELARKAFAEAERLSSVPKVS